MLLYSRMYHIEEENQLLQAWSHFEKWVILINEPSFLFFLVEERQLWVRPIDWIVETQLCKVRGTSDTFVGVLILSFVIWFLWTKATLWLLIRSFTKKNVRVCSMFYPYEGYRSVTPLDAARVNRTISHNHSVHWYYITLIECRDYIKH